jgi:hypothetical protein
MAKQEQLLALLYQALAEPIGLVLEVSDPGRFKQQLYQARAKSCDPELAGLQFRMWPEAEGGNFVIVKAKCTPGRASPTQDLLSELTLSPEDLDV